MELKEPNKFIKLDAKKLLVKLHLAAAQQVRPKVAAIKNAAILKEAASDTPEQPGKCTFDLKSGPGYEVGVFLTADKYVPSYESLFKDYKNIVLSKQTIEDSKKKDIEEKLEKENDKRKKEIEDQMAKLKKDAVEALNIYFENFVGKKNVQQFSVDDLVVSRWPDVKNKFDKIIVKEGKIAKPDDQEIALQYEKCASQFKKDAETKVDNLASNAISMSFCFKVKYSIVFGK